MNINPEMTSKRKFQCFPLEAQMENKGSQNKIVVVGAGISGLTSALHIAESGHNVILIDKAPCSGGILPFLDHQFPNDHCGMCRILPMIKREGSQEFCLKRGIFHENIEFLPHTTITSVDGTPGNMTVSLTSSDTEEVFERENISAVILAISSDLYDPSNIDFYGMSHMPNVITAISFERIISAGSLKRPSDDTEPHKIAWIQCVGSRNIIAGSPSCSSACCMFAVKEAVLAKEKTSSRADTAIFYMDMRTFGRDFQRYRDSAEYEKGVRFIRCRVHSIEPAAKEGDLAICFIDNNGDKKKETFNLVVLSTGKNQLDENNLHRTLSLNKGVYLLGSAKEFRDISEAVKGAQAAVCEITGIMNSMPIQKREPFKTYNESAFLQKAAPLALLLKNGILKKSTDCNAIGEEIENQFKGVETILVDQFDDDFLEHIREKISEKKINRLLAASEQPAVDIPSKNQFATLFGIPSEYIRLVSLFPNFEKVDSKKEIDQFIVSRISEGLSYLLRARQYPDNPLPARKKTLILGSGPAGLSAAKYLLDSGIEVVMVEKEDTAGGNIPEIAKTETREKLSSLLNDVSKSSGFQIITEAELESHSGRPGNFTTGVILKSGETITIDHGAVVIATGGKMATPVSYSYGKDQRILTIHDLQKRVPDLTNPKQVAMIQCVDSREEPRNYCSRICCVKSIETAIALKDKNPDTSIFIFYRDLMTYGESENLYTEARKKGVIFIPYNSNTKPVVTSEKKGLMLLADDPLSGTKIKLSPDLIALAPGLVPGEGSKIPNLFQINTTEDGFIREADYKWRPVDTGKEGIFVCGLARAPGRIDEVMEDGMAAAARVTRLLGSDPLLSSAVSAKVKHAVCSRCGLCMEVCPFHARYHDEKTDRVTVDPASCQGCGTCAVECPNSATVISGFEDGAVLEALETLL
jgi:heterodisulfide reductase subunit A2